MINVLILLMQALAAVTMFLATFTLRLLWELLCWAVPQLWRLLSDAVARYAERRQPEAARRPDPQTPWRSSSDAHSSSKASVTPSPKRAPAARPAPVIEAAGSPIQHERSDVRGNATAAPIPLVALEANEEIPPLFTLPASDGAVYASDGHLLWRAPPIGAVQ